MNYKCGKSKGGVNDVEDEKYLRLGCDDFEIIKSFITWEAW